MRHIESASGALCVPDADRLPRGLRSPVAGDAMHARDIPNDAPTLDVLAWTDPVIDQVGYDPRSLYVERFWLGILGPSATWLMRYLVDRLEQSPEGYTLDLDECATALGLGRYRGSSGAFPRTIARCCQFGASRLTGASTLEVRRRLPPLTRRQVVRLSPILQADHACWVDQAPAAIAGGSTRRWRARPRRGPSPTPPAARTTHRTPTPPGRAGPRPRPPHAFCARDRSLQQPFPRTKRVRVDRWPEPGPSSPPACSRWW